MATMNRNINLEEIQSDAFLGIPYLNYQTVIQKTVFWGGVISAIAWNVVGNFFFHIHPILIVISTLIPIFIGVIFGCNYNQDLSLYKHICLLLFKPCTVLVSKPTEDLEQLKMAAMRIARDRELKEKQQQAASPEEQKKMLIKLVAGALIFILLFVVVVLVILSGKTDEIHHVVNT